MNTKITFITLKMSSDKTASMTYIGIKIDVILDTLLSMETKILKKKSKRLNL